MQRSLIKFGTAGVGLLLATQATVGAAAAQDAATIAKGQALFMEHGCYGCHTVGKVGTPIAPDLARIGAKRDRAYLSTWLRDPSAQRPTAHMPKITLGAGDAEALAAYLSTLR
jgi:mono/diheme cytochrome c family protein